MNTEFDITYDNNPVKVKQEAGMYKLTFMDGKTSMLYYDGGEWYFHLHNTEEWSYRNDEIEAPYIGQLITEKKMQLMH